MPMNHKLSDRFDAIMDEIRFRTNDLTVDERAAVLQNVRDQLAVTLQAMDKPASRST